MDKNLREERDRVLISRRREIINDLSLGINEYIINRSAGFKLFTPELKRIANLITKRKSEEKFSYRGGRSWSKEIIEQAAQHNMFSFLDENGLHDFLSTHVNHCSRIHRERKSRADKISYNKDRYDGSITPRQKLLAIRKEQWSMDFGSRNDHKDAWKDLSSNVGSSKFELECGGFNGQLIHMDGLLKLEDISNIIRIETKIILYAELLSTNQHGLKVFKAKWIKPSNDFPYYNNESGFIFLFEDIALAYKKNASSELRISTAVNDKLQERYMTTAMTRINEIAGKPIPYYLYRKITDYISNHSGSVMDAITDFRFQVLMANELNVEEAA